MKICKKCGIEKALCEFRIKKIKMELEIFIKSSCRPYSTIKNC